MQLGRGNSRGCITLTRLRITLSSAVTFNSVFPANFSVRKFALEPLRSRAVFFTEVKRDCTANNI